MNNDDLFRTKTSKQIDAQTNRWLKLQKQNKLVPKKNRVVKNKKKRYIYVLELENNQFYIGQTTNVERRIEQHKGVLIGGAVFTKNKKILSVLEVIPLKEMTMGEAMEFENNKTLEYINKYGFKNVKGGDYCN